MAFYKFAFPDKSLPSVKIDAGEFLGEKPVPDAREAQQFVGSEIEIVSDSEVRGYTRVRGGWNNGTAYTVFFHAVFNYPFKNFKTWKGDHLSATEKSQADEGKKTGALLFFNAYGGDALEMKIGISFISVLKAQQNIQNKNFM